MSNSHNEFAPAQAPTSAATSATDTEFDARSSAGVDSTTLNSLSTTPADAVTVKDNVENVLQAAMHIFAERGFSETKLEAISRATGMSKRMIHYHFGDKKGLYNQCLIRAVDCLRPGEVPNIDVAQMVPVDGVKTVVEVIFQNYVDNPDAIRLLTLEDLNEWSKLSDSVHLSEYSNITLQLDKLLLRGQDSGAFRPGIATQDILTLITSLASFRLIGNGTALDLYGVDLMHEENTFALKHMTVDLVLAFLTSNLPAGPGVSYITRNDSSIASPENDEAFTYEINVDPFE
ncbi:MAG: TetR/AcrR family transcriptional regulator [Corynebacterium sp.]|nr:TetR/AcrR family transcriptional regulator [Corynebacterium sp.]